jgi:hypothetical protein
VAEFLYTRDNAFRAIVVDATIEEVHTDTATITDHPVAEGSDVSDHVRKDLARLVTGVFVTNTPIVSPNVDGADGRVGSVDLDGSRSSFSKYAKQKESAEQQTKTLGQKVNVLQFSEEFDRLRDVYAQFLREQEAGTIFTVITSVREYDSMVIQEIGLPRDNRFKGAAQFSITWKQFRFVSTETADVPAPLETRAERERRRGAQGAEEEEDTRAISTAAAVIEEFTDFDFIRPGG